VLAPQLSLAKIRLAAYGLRRTSLPRAWVNLRQTLPSGGSLSFVGAELELYCTEENRLRDSQYRGPGGRKRGLKNADGGA
jgi:hypothetical protein